MLALLIAIFIQFNSKREKRKKINRCHTVTVTEKFKQSEHFIEYKSMIAQYDTDTRTHTFGLEFYFYRKSLPCECMLCMCAAGALKLIMFIYFLFACLLEVCAFYGSNVVSMLVSCPLELFACLLACSFACFVCLIHVIYLQSLVIL